MKKKLTVMVPVDFTPVSWKAIEFLGFLMDKTPVATHLVHVVQVNEAEWAEGPETEALDHSAIRALEQQAELGFAGRKQQVDFTFTKAILHGGLTSTLAGYAHDHQIDLVIMGTRGADGWYETLSGPEAQQVVRQCQVPVVTVHQHATITPIHNLLWVADFAAVKTLQRLFGARLHLLQLLRQADQEPFLPGSLQDFADEHQLEHYELHLHRENQLPQGVRHFSQQAHMDLVIIGTPARKGLGHLLQGSTAETLVNRCSHPLLTYHLQ